MITFNQDDFSDVPGLSLLAWPSPRKCDEAQSSGADTKASASRLAPLARLPTDVDSQLHDDGLLTVDEFNAKKAELLARL